MTPELLHVTYEGRQYDIPVLWVVGYEIGHPGSTVLEAIQCWHTQTLLGEEPERQKEENNA